MSEAPDKSLNESMDEGLDALKQLEEMGYRTPMSPRRLVRKLAKAAGMYPLPEPAVEKCEAQYTKTAKEAIDEKKSKATIKSRSKLAYSHAMPRLNGATNIREFIACVAHGMLIDVFTGAEGARLLYAAQVANQAHQTRRKKPNNTSLKQPIAATVKSSKSTT